MDETLKDNIIDARKYAIMVWALATVRGTLYSVMQGDQEHLSDVQEVLEVTSLNRLAERFGCNESDLAIDWVEYLTNDEMRI